MVGPSRTADERRVASRRLKVGFVALVGLSGGLVAVQAGGTPIQIAVAVGGGLAVGGALLAFLVRLGRDL